MKLPGIALLASSLLIAPVAFANSSTNTANINTQARPYMQQMINRHVERLSVVFNLAPDQQKQANADFKNAYEANHDIAMNLHTARKTLENDVNAKVDQAKLTADASVIGQDEAKIVANNALAREEFLLMLNPQEQAKYEKFANTMPGFGWGEMAPGALYR